MAFFTAELFKKHSSNILSDEQCSYAAKIADNIIRRNGILLHGNLLEGNVCVNWSSKKKRRHRHHCIAFGFMEKGVFDDEEDHRFMKPTSLKEEEEQTEKMRIKQLEEINEQLKATNESKLEGIIS